MSPHRRIPLRLPSLTGHPRVSNRTLLAIGAACLMAVAGACGGLRAHQVLAENSARGHMEAARAAAQAGLERAAATGLRQSETAPYRSQFATISRAHAPAPSIWSSAQVDFYNRQAVAYRSLLVRVGAAVKRVTRETREKTLRRIARATSIDATGRALDLDTTSFHQRLAAAERAERTASSPRQHRAILRDLHALIASFEPWVLSRQRAVAALITSAHGSVQALRNAADARIAAAQQSLSLLSLFTARGKTYDAQLSALATAIHRQTAIRQAAVKMVTIEDLANRIAADYDRTIPAKLILVSTEDQSAQLYDHGNVIYSTPVTTGGPELPTDHGVFHIYFKASPFEFHSPWPPDSPYYYPPTPVQFWMPFDGAEGLHDASWRSNFGPGSNLAPTDLGTGNYILGTHGCVNLPYDAAQFIWDWAPVGTTVAVI